MKKFRRSLAAAVSLLMIFGISGLSAFAAQPPGADDPMVLSTDAASGSELPTFEAER